MLRRLVALLVAALGFATVLTVFARLAALGFAAGIVALGFDAGFLAFAPIALVAEFSPADVLLLAMLVDASLAVASLATGVALAWVAKFILKLTAFCLHGLLPDP